MIRNRRFAIATFVVVALMLVSVGFAAITGKLTITTTAKSGPQDFNVVFTQAKATAIVDSVNDGKAVSVKVENTKLEKNVALPIGGDTGSFVISMTAENLATTGDYVTVLFTVKNNNKVAMKVTPGTVSTTVFDVDFGFVGTGSDLDDVVQIAAGESKEFSVTVKLISDAYDTEQSETFDIVLNATSDIG